MEFTSWGRGYEVCDEYVEFGSYRLRSGDIVDALKIELENSCIAYLWGFDDQLVRAMQIGAERGLLDDDFIDYAFSTSNIAYVPN